MFRPTPLMGSAEMFTTLQFRLLLGVLALCLSSCGQSVPSPSLTPLMSGQTLRVVSESQDLTRNSEPQWATDCQGNFVVVWTGHSRKRQQGSAIYVQRYNRMGSPQGERILVTEGVYDPDINADIALFQEHAVSMNCQGDFVVAWKQVQTFDIASIHPTRYDIFLQRYNHLGQAAGSAIRSAEPTQEEKVIYLMGVKLNNENNILVTWAGGFNDTNIYGQYYDLQVTDLIVTPNRTSLRDYPSSLFPFIPTTSLLNTMDTAANPQGEFLVTWLFGSEVHLKHYIKGQAQHTQVLHLPLSELPIEPQGLPGNRRFGKLQVLPTQSGDFVVIWTQGKSAYAQRYLRQGTLQETGKIIMGQHFAINNKDQLISVWEENEDPVERPRTDPFEFVGPSEKAVKRIYLQTYNTQFEALNPEPILFKELPYFSSECDSCLLVANTPDNGAKVLWLQRPGEHNDVEGIYVEAHTFDPRQR